MAHGPLVCVSFAKQIDPRSDVSELYVLWHDKMMR